MAFGAVVLRRTAIPEEFKNEMTPGTFLGWRRLGDIVDESKWGAEGGELDQGGGIFDFRRFSIFDLGG